MLRWLTRWLLRILLVLFLGLALLAAPIAYNEFACRADRVTDVYDPLITDAAYQRPEARTLLTYPEWHIVNAYDDYARVIRTGDPHDYGFFEAITGYWVSLCTLTTASANHGGFDSETRQLVYVIGASFTLEFALKAAYEETLGRIATWIRGPARAATDEVSASLARDYAEFLQQTPWYKWNFDADIDALKVVSEDAFRDRERIFALGLEFGAKSAYAGLIDRAVSLVGPDELRLRSVIRAEDREIVSGLADVAIIGPRGEGIEIETPRYRAFTEILLKLTAAGVNLIEIAGNDDIMLSVITPGPEFPLAAFTLPRQGYDDFRHLVLIKVTELGQTLRSLEGEGARLEHVFDY